MLLSLQVLRGLAALGVVLFHLLPFEAKHLPGDSIVPAGFAAGRAGVDLFFVISGFLAVWTTRSTSGGVQEAWRFLLRRITRIYPTYWVYCLPLLVAAALAPAAGTEDARPDIIASLLLVPSAAPPLLLVAWTLVFEIYFYLAFALLICARLRGRWRGHGLLLWGAVVLAGHLLLHPARSEATLDAALSPLVFEFLAGCCAAYVCRSALLRTTGAFAGLLACILLVASLLSYGVLFDMPWVRVTGFGVGGALLLIGCVRCEEVLRAHLPRWIVRVGDSSYSLYLSHLFTFALVGRGLSVMARHIPVLATPSGHIAALVIAVLSSLLVADVSYHWIELPLLRLTRRLAAPPSLISAVSIP